jgi:5-methylcytosine-specific restriction endonuclease McrA
MKTTKPNAERVWKQLEDQVVPRLHLSPVDRAVYSHLLRHSRIEGKSRMQFSIRGLARQIHARDTGAREAVRRLIENGALRLVERSKAGHLVEVRLPEEISGLKVNQPKDAEPVQGSRAGNLEEVDFMQSKALREAIHGREGGLCFYCLRQLAPTLKCLDHVTPRAALGRNSYRNLVSSCLECNSQKGEKPADDFLRGLYRERRLTAAEFNSRLRALAALAAGKLRPVVAGLELRRSAPPSHLSKMEGKHQ